MCIFSGPVDLVGSTRIFVSSLKDGRHSTIYQMAYKARSDLAMILPVPVNRGAGDDSLTFVDFSGYRDFFDDLDRCCFHVGKRTGGGYGGGGHPELKPRLVVHAIGDFFASFVPTMADFDRLDGRYNLPASAWETLPDYSRFGFAVFQLKPGDEAKETHPIAYHYQPSAPHELFAPTTHLHEGGPAQARAEFDHAIYFQSYRQHPNSVPGSVALSQKPPGGAMDLAKAKGLLAGDRHVSRLVIDGIYPNADLVMEISDPNGPPHRSPSISTRPVRVPWEMGSSLGWYQFCALGKGVVHTGHGY